MTRDELKDLACLGFSADMVMQSFCHTAAYPKLVDVKMHRELPSFICTRGGVALRPGDGVIHSWLNRLLLPDTVGTGVMPLDMPESVLVRFKGKLQEGVTLRDLVNAIPYYAILGKSGACMEMPGCSLCREANTLGVCMGNQAQIRKGSTAMSTSTRNFPNRLGIDTFVYLGSAELASICAPKEVPLGCALMGKIPTVAEYMEQVKVVNAKAADVYRYMNFDKIAAFKEVADTVTV
jgi:aconitase B